MTGGWGLLRSAGLPIRLWLAAANPDLFDRIRSLVDLEDEYTTAAARVAEELGEDLVPHPALEPPTRRLALACRRRLHQGRPAGPDAGTLAERAIDLRRYGLAERLTEVAHLADRLTADGASIEAALTAERDRLLVEPWTALNATPVGRWALADGTIATGADIDRRLREGASWRGKRLRQRSDYLWRMVARGAVKTTPRSWLGHAALVTFGPPAGEFVDLGAAVATRWTGNVHTGRSERAAAVDLAEDDPIALAPLHRRIDDHIEVWVVRPDRPDSVRPVRMRLTRPLAAVRTALSRGARPVRDVVDDLLPAGEPPAARASVRAFVGHLVGLGVCQISPSPVVRRTGWCVAPDGPRATEDGFHDVYRRPCGPWPADVLGRVANGVALSQRITAVIDADERTPPDPMPEIGVDPRPVLDVFAERLAATPDADLTPVPPSPVWPAPRRPDSAYARLVRWLSAASAEPVAALDIPASLLDGIGAPPARCAWPVDCVVRPLRSGPVVLDVVAPAGILDARFNAELEALHGPLPQQEEYREMLRRLDEVTGVRSVELLVPPLSERAANAVRRPLYPSAWTGDPDLRAYCAANQWDAEQRAAEYVPLSDLTVRRADGTIVVEAAGAPVRVTYHATRVPRPPWNVLVAILMGATDRIDTRFRRLRHSLPALPERRSMPRLTLGGGAVIVTPAQWRLGPGELWDPLEPMSAKVKHLVRLRARLGLPRWVMACAAAGGRPVGCDLDSLHALSTMEAAAARSVGDEPWIVLEEMVPGPAELMVRDALAGSAEAVAAELMIRVPQHVDPATLAARAAAAMRAPHCHHDPAPQSRGAHPERMITWNSTMR